MAHYNKMSIDKNCFERDTEILGKAQTRSEILSLYLISSAISRYQYQNALQLIQNCQKTVEFEDENILIQLKLMSAYCYFHLKQFQNVQNICGQIYEELQKQQSILQKSHQGKSMSKTMLYQQLRRSFSVRFYTFVISIFCRNININFINPQQLTRRLIRVLQIDQFIYLEEVLGSLTGCKNFKEVRKIQVLSGEETKKKAMKLEILGNWKFLAGQLEDSIKFKRQALHIWMQENCLHQKEKCQAELKQFIQYNQDPKNKGKFILKILRLMFFVQRLVKFEEQVDQKPKRPHIKWTFPALISSIQYQQQDREMMSNLAQSKFTKANQKKEQLKKIIDLNEQFYSSYKKQKHGQITNLIISSYFADQQTKEMRKKFKIFFKFVYRISFIFIMECAVERGKFKKGQKSK